MTTESTVVENARPDAIDHRDVVRRAVRVHGRDKIARLLERSRESLLAYLGGVATKSTDEFIERRVEALLATEVLVESGILDQP